MSISTSQYILTCKCSGTPQKAKIAYDILFPDSQIEPKIYKGPDAVRKLAENYQGTNFGTLASAIAKIKSRFAYYIEVDENGNVIEQYDLLTNKRVA